jgi:hypothetical protein
VGGRERARRETILIIYRMRCRILKAIVWNFGILCMRCRHDTNQEMAMGRAGRRGSCHSPWTMDNDGDGYRSHL